MRVIAGSAGGIPLACPRSGDVRPTMDQVRGAIFSSLAERVPGARVLDLFAGAGGLGIEALSRGAREATFVESDHRVAASIRANLEKTRLAARATVICRDAFAFLQEQPAPFDLILADPPYTTAAQPEDTASRLLASVALRRALTVDGTLVLEKSPRHSVEIPAAWTVVRQKRYGTTEVLFLVPVPANEMPLP